jgi:hypothetical protein
MARFILNIQILAAHQKRNISHLGRKLMMAVGNQMIMGVARYDTLDASDGWWNPWRSSEYWCTE